MSLHEILSTLPPLYTHENLGWENTPKPVRFAAARIDWQWIPTEYDPVEKIAFGMVHGFESEIGYFSLADLEEAVAFLIE